MSTQDAGPKVTLLVPTRERPRLLERCLRYYEEARFPAPIKILDSSTVENAARVRAACARHPGLDLELRGFPPQTRLASKMAAGLAHASTPFVAFCADDDFVIPSSIDTCVAALETRPTASAAIGGNAYFETRGVGARTYLAFRELERGRGLEHPSASSRLLDHFAAPLATFYAVHRRDLHLANWEATARMDDDDARFLEQLSSAYTLVQGHLLRVPTLHAVREVHAVQTSRRSPTWAEIAAHPHYRERYGRFRELLAEPLAKADGLTLADAQQVVDAAWARYLSLKTSPPRLTWMQRARATIRALPGIATSVDGVRAARARAGALPSTLRPYATALHPITRIVRDDAKEAARP